MRKNLVVQKRAMPTLRVGSAGESPVSRCVYVKMNPDSRKNTLTAELPERIRLRPKPESPKNDGAK